MTTSKKSKIMNLLGFPKKEADFSTSDSDPMNLAVFPDEIRQFIVGYLSNPDLLSASLVSKLWFETIGSSLAFKKNVFIKLHLWNCESPPSLVDSSRDFENITISNFKITSAILKGINNKDWKNVTLSIGKISSQNSFIKLLETFESLKNLKILSTQIKNLNSGQQPLTLAQLNHLTLSDVTLDLFDMLIVNQPSLKSLSLRFVSCDIASPRRVGEALVEFFKFNQQLRNLEINYLITNDLFLVDIKDLPLKLKTLSIGFDSTSSEVRAHIEQFIRSQGNYLEHLKLTLHQNLVHNGRDEWGYWNRSNQEEVLDFADASVIFNTWNSLTTLKSIAIRFLKSTAEMKIPREFLKTLKNNPSVTSLYIQFMNVNAPTSIAIEIMKLSPKLQEIYVTKLTPEIVRFAATNLKGLRKIKCFSFNGECQQEYVQLKAARNDVNILISITDRCALG